MPGFADLHEVICPREDTENLKKLAVAYPVSIYHIYRAYQMLGNSYTLTDRAAELMSHGTKFDDAVREVLELTASRIQNAVYTPKRVRVLKIG